MFYVSLIHGDHKAKTYGRYTKDKKKRLKYTPTKNKSQRKGAKEFKKSHKTINARGIVRPYLSINTFSINGLNSPNKNQSG